GKVYGSEAYNDNADEALQVFGGYGFSEEYPPAKMYRDSRITRIYEGTNEICRLYAQRAIFKRLAGAGAGPGAPETGHEGAAAGALEAVAHLKQIYFMLVQEVVTGLGPEKLKDPDNQQFLASLADVAMEIYAAESVALRVAKLHGTGSAEAAAVRAGLAALALDRSAERVRAEARTVLGELHPGDDGAQGLADVDALLPPPGALVGIRAQVSRWLVARQGLLPGEAE
ncbi:MAG TPA: acyl-CoA dehydrogenase family protein, partial [Longimicrobiales bacterium]|nr:acyl-CoA dehydrogenase family protein [Longimicrobiales bacterium]